MLDNSAQSSNETWVLKTFRLSSHNGVINVNTKKYEECNVSIQLATTQSLCPTQQNKQSNIQAIRVSPVVRGAVHAFSPLN